MGWEDETAEDWGRDQDHDIARLLGGILGHMTGRDAAQLWALNSDALRIALSESTADRFPAEPPDGSVLRYTRNLSGRHYTYVALRVGEKWYQTGRATRPLVWDELIEQIGDNPCWIATDWAPCWIATDWAEIPAPEPSPVESMTPQEGHQQMFPQAGSMDGPKES